MRWICKKVKNKKGEISIYSAVIVFVMLLIFVQLFFAMASSYKLAELANGVQTNLDAYCVSRGAVNFNLLKNMNIEGNYYTASFEEAFFSDTLECVKQTDVDGTVYWQSKDGSAEYHNVSCEFTAGERAIYVTVSYDLKAKTVMSGFIGVVSKNARSVFAELAGSDPYVGK